MTTIPKILYHASSNRKIRMLEPRALTIRDRNEGPVVFATPDKAEASKFLVPSDDSWTRKSRFGDVHVHIISDRKRYEKADKGGAIYHLSSDTFENDETKGARTEWTSKRAVRPISKEEYGSGLQAQLDNGVQVFFVDKATFAEIVNSGDHGNAIMRSLESENKKRNVSLLKVPTTNS